MICENCGKSTVVLVDKKNINKSGEEWSDFEKSIHREMLILALIILPLALCIGLTNESIGYVFVIGAFGVYFIVKAIKARSYNIVVETYECQYCKHRWKEIKQ